MNRKKFFVALTIFLALIFITAQNAWPDFGSFSGNSDYDSGSRSSSGSSHSSSHSSSSSSSSSSRSYGGYSSGSSRHSSSNNFSSNGFNSLTATSGALGGNDSDDIMGVVAVFVLVGIFFLLISMRKKQRQSPVIINTNRAVRQLNPMEDYLKLDPNFDGERITTLIANLYVQMQETWHAKDISPIRPYFTDEFYNQMDKQLEEFRKQNRTDYTERIAVLNVELIGWRQAKGRDYITVGLNTRIVSYVLDDMTGELVSGDKKKEKFMEYELELTRKSGEFTTPEGTEIKSETCPHCGAPLKINASARCEYCGSIVTTVNTDWAVCAMRGISQRTA